MNGKKILVVDDDPDIRLLIDYQMSEEGYEILEASDGLEALEVLKENTVDLIITDLTMPNIDGYELIKVLKGTKEISKVPILMLTAKEGESISKSSMTYQPDDFLPKPFTKEDLKNKVKKLLNL